MRYCSAPILAEVHIYSIARDQTLPQPFSLMDSPDRFNLRQEKVKREFTQEVEPRRRIATQRDVSSSTTRKQTPLRTLSLTHSLHLVIPGREIRALLSGAKFETIGLCKQELSSAIRSVVAQTQN
jgi:hypothetical protein